MSTTKISESTIRYNWNDCQQEFSFEDDLGNVYEVRPYNTKHDPVNHPKHYTQHPSGVECIEVTQHYNFCVGNAIKYLWRAGLKTETNMDTKQKQIEDLNKAVWYIQREIRNLESNKYE